MTLANWVRWAFRPCKYWNHYPSAVFVRQASRDLGRAVSRGGITPEAGGRGNDRLRRPRA